MDGYWSVSYYNYAIGLAVVIGIILQNVVLFGDNIENYNWGLITLLVALALVWTCNKLLEYIVAVRCSCRL